MPLSLIVVVHFLFCFGRYSAWNDLESEIRDLYHDLDVLEAELSDARRQVHTKERSQHDGFPANNATWSAFTAAVATGTDEFVAEGSVITFDDVIVNEGICPCNLEGECFDTLFGFFLCPETAMYYFLVSLVSPSDHVNNVYLRMDTQPVLNIMAAVNTTADFLSGSIQSGVILQCSQGSKVAVVADSGVNNENYVTLVPGTQSSFVGFRI